MNADDVLRELDALTHRYETRLANQRQVIDNLDTARQDALSELQAWRDFGQWVVDNEPTVGAIHATVTDLLARQEKP